MAGEWKKLLDDAKVPPEKRAEIEAALSNVDTLVAELDKGVMRQADYSRNMDALKSRKAELEANWEKANKEYQTMVGDLESTQAERDTARKEADEAKKKMESLPKLPDGFDPSKVLTIDQVTERERNMASAQTAYFGDVLEIVAEHNQLFGQRLSPKTFMQEAIAAGKPPMEYWSEKYNVPAKREEIAKAEQAKQQTEWEKKGYEQRVAEEANPATRTLKPSQNPFFEPADATKSAFDTTGPTEAENTLLLELQKARG